VREIRGAFDRLFTHPDTRPVTPEWIRDYRKRRIVRPAVPAAPADGLADRGEPPETPPAAPRPTPIQQEALDALQATRDAGNQAGLVVLATGLGKTWLAAFDSDRPEFRRILFVAHREEILEQARATFRRLHPTVELGFYSGSEKLPEAPILFAMVQTLGRDARPSAPLEADPQPTDAREQVDEAERVWLLSGCPFPHASRVEPTVLAWGCALPNTSGRHFGFRTSLDALLSPLDAVENRNGFTRRRGGAENGPSEGRRASHGLVTGCRGCKARDDSCLGALRGSA
jgi:hypothetical protein